MFDDVAMVMMVHPAPAAICVRTGVERTGVDTESNRCPTTAAGGAR